MFIKNRQDDKRTFRNDSYPHLRGIDDVRILELNWKRPEKQSNAKGGRKMMSNEIIKDDHYQDHIFGRPTHVFNS